MLSPYGKNQILIIVGLALIGIVAFALLGWWVAVAITVLSAIALLAFFRDPSRRVPTLRGQVVAACDGKVSSIHDIEHFEPFGGPAKCIRVFLSVLDVHVNRSPLYGRVVSVTHKPGKKLNALRPESAEQNESMLMVLENPTTHQPVAAVRQIAGMIARTIVCGIAPGDILQRGQRYGMIKFGSTTEVYLPDPDRLTVHVRQGQYVWGGETVLAMINGVNVPASGSSEQTKAAEPPVPSQSASSVPPSDSASA